LLLIFIFKKLIRVSDIMVEKNYRKFCFVIVLILSLFYIIPSAMAFETRNGDVIEINSPIDDDLLASGGSMVVNAPVKSITWAGGTLIINAPIKTNLVAIGGTIQSNAPVGTDLIAIGGDIHIKGDVGGKVLGIGGSVTMDGDTENIATTGGTFILGKNSTIFKDALVSSSGFTTQGRIEGNLTVEKDNNDSILYTKIGELINTFVLAVKLIQFIGLLILGIILAILMPGFFLEVTKTSRQKPLMSLGAGVLGIILSFALFVILLITIIGIPIAIFLILLVSLGLILSTIMTGGTIGVIIMDRMRKRSNIIPGFIIGFIILNIIFLIPFIGIIVWLLAVCFGFGALILSVYISIQDM